MAVTTFQSQRQLAFEFVEVGSKANQFADAFRSFSDNQFDHIPLAHPFASRHRVVDMIRKIVKRIKHSRDATLSPGAV